MVGSRLLWVDVETDGLRSDSLLLELGLRWTTSRLEPLDGGIAMVIGHAAVDWSNPVTVRMHGCNGLLDQVLAPGALSLDVASGLAAAYVERGVRDADSCLLAGASVGFDRRVLDHWMPGLLAGFSHRTFDVSVMLEALRLWRPDAYARRPERLSNHRVAACLSDELRLARFLMGVACA